MWGLVATETNFVLPRPLEVLGFWFSDEAELEAIKASPGYEATSKVLFKMLVNLSKTNVGEELATEIGAIFAKGERELKYM